MGDRELSLIDKKVTSLLDVPLHPGVTSLILHCNQISRIEGLTAVWQLKHLDLSSNCISRIEGLSSLTSLRTLNLACNKITKVEGLNGLVELTTLNLSFNQINNLSGLLFLHGTENKLKHLILRGNRLDNINHLLQCLLGLQGLIGVTLSKDGIDNPVCRSPGYRETIMHSLPQVSALDGLDRQGNPSYSEADSLGDVPGLEDYLDLLLSSDNNQNEVAKEDGPVTGPGMDEVLAHFRQRVASEATAGPAARAERQLLKQAGSTVADPAVRVYEQRFRKLEHQMSQLMQQAPAGEKPGASNHSVVKVRKAKRDTDQTSESECDSGKENSGRRSRIPKYRNTTATKTKTRENKGRRAESDQENPKQKSSKTAVGPRRNAGNSGGADAAGPARRAPLRAAKTSCGLETKSTVEEETYRVIVEERDQERERRWKAEQAVRRLTEELECLNAKVGQEKDLQSMAQHATIRLKELLLKEQSARSELQTHAEELEGRNRSLTQQLEQSRSTEEQHKTALHNLQENISHGEVLRARQQAEEMKRQQEMKNQAAALRKELDIQRASVLQHKDKLQQLHELLASREQEHRKQLEMRQYPGWTDFREAVAKEVASAEQKHGQREAELKEKLDEARKAYAALEDEFRMALTTEAARFSKVKEACDQMTAELMERKVTLSQSQQKERESGSLVQELMAMVKEQKSCISELMKAKKDAVTDLKRRLRCLEAEAEAAQGLARQLEILKQDKKQLSSQLTAQNSLIEGLRAEKQIWGQELALQGTSLAQDRGRLEARIEVLAAELEKQKKQTERDADTLKIRGKIIDDQTETIRKLKEGLQERDEQARKLREEAVQAQKKLQEKLQEEAALEAELREQLEHLSTRKVELKQQLEDKEAELEEVKRKYRDSSKKWHETTDMLTRLESQVKRMRENFDTKLLEERHKAMEAERAAVEKLHDVDDAFREQLESVQAAHQTELLQLANEKQKLIDRAHQKVLRVENEMRELLKEIKKKEKNIKEKLGSLNDAVTDFDK